MFLQEMQHFMLIFYKIQGGIEKNIVYLLPK